MKRLPSCLWWSLPVLSLAMVTIPPLFGSETWYRLIERKEYSILEIGTEPLLLAGIIFGVLAAWRMRTLAMRGRQWAIGWVLLLTLGAVYFCGEECSWGQTYLPFGTPEQWAGINEQRETNLHNLVFTTPVLDNLLNNTPRQLLLVLIIVGGIIVPLAGRRRLDTAPIDSAWRFIGPNWRLAPMSVLAAVSTVPEKIADILREKYDIAVAPDSYVAMAFIRPGGEFKEACFAAVILLYLAWVFQRSRAAPMTTVQPVDQAD